MRTITLQRSQTKVAQEGIFSLPVLAGSVSPYFRIDDAGRVTQLTLKKMKAIIGGVTTFGYPNYSSFTVVYFSSAGVADPTSLLFDISLCSTEQEIKDSIKAAVIAYSITNGYGITGNGDILYGFGDFPAAMGNAPQAAIANAPADAVTNYNIVTTLLGALTSAVNAANTKQNDIATKLNSLLSELRTLGLITP